MSNKAEDLGQSDVFYLTLCLLSRDLLVADGVGTAHVICLYFIVLGYVQVTVSRTGWCYSLRELLFPLLQPP